MISTIQIKDYVIGIYYLIHKSKGFIPKASEEPHTFAVGRWVKHEWFNDHGVLCKTTKFVKNG